jgi:hypothetical protein
MSQPLWFLRHDDRIIGPFPAPQIREFLEEGEVTPDWEISLDEVDWLSIRESGQFDQDKAAWLKSGEHGRHIWREEREQARHRWLQDMGETGDLAQAEPHDATLEQQSRQALEQDQRHTETLLQQERTRRPPVISGLLAILVVVVIAYFVWWGQKGESGIQTEIGLVANCAQPLQEAVNWSRCNKRNFAAPGAVARNTRMENVILEGADLAGADLSYAALGMANLRNANLRGINLSGSDLTGADLSGSDLSLADLRYAVLQDAQLEGVRLDGAMLDKATWVDGHVCPEGAVGQCP